MGFHYWPRCLTADARRARREALLSEPLGRVDRPDPLQVHLTTLELEFCIGELSRRSTADPRYAWLWGTKHKVAKRLLRLARIRPGAAAYGDDPLSDEHRAQLIRSHPLLQNSRLRPVGSTRHSDEEWFEEIRRKVDAYVAYRHGRICRANREG